MFNVASPIQTLTVGSGITPDQPFGSRAFTAGTELHLSLKFVLMIAQSRHLSTIIHKTILHFFHEMIEYESIQHTFRLNK